MKNFLIIPLTTIILVVFTLFSCNKKSLIEDKNVIQIKANTNSTLKFANYIDSIKYIQLESTLDMPISRISDILFGDNLILIVDDKNLVVYMFDETGKYLRKINAKGKGPGEYTSIGRVMLDRTNGIVMVYDKARQHLLKYDLEGNFINTLEQFGGENKLPRDIINLESGEFLCYQTDKSGKDENVGLWLVNNAGEFIKYIKQIDETYPFISPYKKCYLYHTKEGIGFQDQLTNSIYTYKNGKLNKTVTYDFPGKNLLDYKGESYIQTEMPVNDLTFTVESDSVIISQWVDNKMRNFLVAYSKKDKSFEEGKESFSSSEYIMLPGISVRNNQPGIWTCIIELPALLLFTESNTSNDSFAKEAKRFLDNKSEEEIYTMNPIIQLLYLKN